MTRLVKCLQEKEEEKEKEKKKKHRIMHLSHNLLWFGRRTITGNQLHREIQRAKDTIPDFFVVCK